MWELDCEESWVLKNWCFWIVVLEKTLENPLDCKEIQPVHPKGNQPWIFPGRTDTETEVPVLWPPDVKSQLIEKDPDAGEKLKAGGEGDNRGWDGWMASLTQWIWVWANARRQWRTGKPGVLQLRGSKRVAHDLVRNEKKDPTSYIQHKGFSIGLIRQLEWYSWKLNISPHCLTLRLMFCLDARSLWDRARARPPVSNALLP